MARKNDNYLAAPFGSSGLGTLPSPPLSGSYGVDSEPDMRRRGRVLPTPTAARLAATVAAQYDPPSLDSIDLQPRRTIQEHVVRVVEPIPMLTTQWGLDGNL